MIVKYSAPIELPHTSLVLIKKKWYVNCTITKDANDFITGHGSTDIAGLFGTGPGFEERRKALDSANRPWL